MRFQFSLRTAAIIVAVFCYLLVNFPRCAKVAGWVTGFPVDCGFPVTDRPTYELSGLWVWSHRLAGKPSRPLVGFVYERRPPFFEVRYLCVWCYERTSTPFAIVYTIEPKADAGWHIQTMPNDVTTGCKIALTLPILFLLCLAYRYVKRKRGTRT